jgi:2-dehydro-3-deoxygalactonokinase
MREKMVSCDWGTSSFRCRLVDLSDLTILSERSSGQGIAATHALWKQRPDKGSKLSFYQSVIGAAIASIGQELNISLHETPLVISGMASSSLGMIELPYREFPFSADGSDLRVERIAANAGFGYETLLISGARTGDDVMRGEETQLVGCGGGNGPVPGEEIFIFPGTHSKHVWVKEGVAVDMKTYMTGEFFELLSKKSILADGVAGGDGLMDGSSSKRFEDGVRAGAGQNLLHAAFLVRTNSLLGGMSKEDNYYFLSGLLIGSELATLMGDRKRMTMVADARMKDYYGVACRVLRMDGMNWEDGAMAVVKGQRRVLEMILSARTKGGHSG